MNNSAADSRIIALERWLDSPAGAYVTAWEQACLNALTVDVFGFHALQIGTPQINALAANRMPHQWLAATRSIGGSGLVSPASRRVAVAVDYAELPFATASMDLVVLPHVLEFAEEPHQVLREVERILIPEGHLIICGFNPASLWGLRQAGRRVGGSPYLPASSDLISLPRLKDWLKLLNLGAAAPSSHFGCYAPACHSTHWLERFSMLETAGRRWWPYLGAVYIVHAIKRVKGMHIIGPGWNKKASKRPAAVPAANRE